VRSQDSTQATQLRLSFAPAPPASLRLQVAGLMLLIEGDRPDAELFTFLKSYDLHPDFRPGLGVSIPARFLPKLAELSVPVSVPEEVAPLWRLITDPPANGLPATVEATAHGYTLAWETADGRSYDEHVTASLAKLFGVIDIPLVATDSVWHAIEQSLPAMGVSGTATVTEDGFVRITTSKPQILAASKLPGLFKISPTTFGVCTAFAADLVSEPGLRWVSRRPVRNPPAIQIPQHLALAPHIRSALPDIVADLSGLGAKAVVWETGLGRRILVLAALEVLDAYPAVVVCPPQSIWLWRRHVEMVGRTCGLLHGHDDVHIVTYHDLANRRLEPQAIVFDDLNSAEAAAAWPALQQMQRYGDAYKIAVEDSWPDDPEESRRLLSILRPAEFATTMSLAERYPTDPATRLREHAGVYLDRRTRQDTSDLRMFRQSSVRVVELSHPQQMAIASAAEKISLRSPSDVFSEILELVSAGPSTTLSPKIGAAVELAREAAHRSRRVALVSRHRRSAGLLCAMLRPEGALPYEQNPSAAVCVLRFDRDLPDLSDFDLVVVLDYPWSLEALERSVLPANIPEGPDVIIVHATGSVDDRLAVFSARRCESSLVSSALEPPSPQDIPQLLAPRW